MNKFTHKIAGVERSFEWGPWVKFRIRSLGKLNSHQFVMASQMLWAALSKKDFQDFPTPEDLGQLITDDEMIELVPKLNGIIEDKSKNGNGSTNAPSHASS